MTGRDGAGRQPSWQAGTDGLAAVGLPVGPPDPDGAAKGKRTYGPDFLTALFQDPLDPGYADAAARRAAEGPRTGVRRGTAGVSAAL
ncbi:hypothetical protein MB27_42165, partial [Actinoplanes utahensis]